MEKVLYPPQKDAAGGLWLGVQWTFSSVLLNFLGHSSDSLKYNLAGFRPTILPFDQERLWSEFLPSLWGENEELRENA